MFGIQADVVTAVGTHMAETESRIEEEGELLEGRRCLTTHLLRGDRHLLGDGSSAVAT